jgi:hypothetical protein
LVCSDDPYICEFEDILFVVSSEVVNELPLWCEGNQNLKENVEYFAAEGNEENKEFDLFCELISDGLIEYINNISFTIHNNLKIKNFENNNNN